MFRENISTFFFFILTSQPNDPKIKVCTLTSQFTHVHLHLSQDGAYIVYIYPNGAANLDKRLQVFDKVTEVEGKKITADMSYSDLKKIFKRRYLVVS